MWLFPAGPISINQGNSERDSNNEKRPLAERDQPFDATREAITKRERQDRNGPDGCIDAVGCEASGHGAADAVLDKVKATAYLATDRVHVLRQAIMCCRKAGTISIPGVYVGMGDKIPLGAAMNKGLTIKTGQTHVQAYTKPLLKLIEDGKIDPSFVVTHPASLEDAPAMYKKFRDKEDGVIKVMLRPGG